jgi:hypothetical protein
MLRKRITVPEETVTDSDWEEAYRCYCRSNDLPEQLTGRKMQLAEDGDGRPMVDLHREAVRQLRDELADVDLTVVKRRAIVVAEDEGRGPVPARLKAKSVGKKRHLWMGYNACEVLRYLGSRSFPLLGVLEVVATCGFKVSDSTVKIQTKVGKAGQVPALSDEAKRQLAGLMKKAAPSWET